MNFNIQSRFGALNLDKLSVTKNTFNIPGTLDTLKRDSSFDRFTLQFNSSSTDKDSYPIKAVVFNKSNKTEDEPNFEYSFRINANGQVVASPTVKVIKPNPSGSLKIGEITEQIHTDVKALSWTEIKQALEKVHSPKIMQQSN